MNPDCPIIGKLGRSFSSSPEEVARHAKAWITAHKKMGVLSCVKHFPGHGSSESDTHLGIADVSETWSDKELIPFRRLIKDNVVDLVMTSHVYNSKLDAEWPATLSEKVPPKPSILLLKKLRTAPSPKAAYTSRTTGLLL